MVAVPSLSRSRFARLTRVTAATLSLAIASSGAACVGSSYSPHLMLAQATPVDTNGAPAPTTSAAATTAATAPVTTATTPSPYADDAPAPPAPTATVDISPTPPFPELQGPAPEKDMIKEEKIRTDPDHRGVRRTAGWVSVAVGTESILVALFTGMVVLHQKSIRDADCSNKVCTPAGVDANTSISNVTGWNTGAWIVGVLGLGAGAILLFTTPSNAEAADKNDHNDDQPNRPAQASARLFGPGGEHEAPRAATGSTSLSIAPNGPGAGLLLRSTF